jgi:hypothetical protein
MKKNPKKNPKEVDRTTLAIVCTHVARDRRPILVAEREALPPNHPRDSGWQFVCGQSKETEATGLVWTIAEAVEWEPTLAPLLSSEPGTQWVRVTESSPWRILA